MKIRRENREQIERERESIERKLDSEDKMILASVALEGRSRLELPSNAAENRNRERILAEYDSEERRSILQRLRLETNNASTPTMYVYVRTYVSTYETSSSSSGESNRRDDRVNEILAALHRPLNFFLFFFPRRALYCHEAPTKAAQRCP